MASAPDSPPDRSQRLLRPGVLLSLTAWVFHWFSPGYACLVAGHVTSAAAAWILQLGAAVGVWVTLQETHVSPLFVSALWLLVQTALALAFNMQGTQKVRAPLWTKPLGFLVAAVTVLLVVLAWRPWSLVPVASTSRSPSGTWAWVRELPVSVQRGDWIAVRCDDDATSGLFRVVALPGETFWFRAGQACFAGSGCLPQRLLQNYGDSKAIEPIRVTLSGSRYYVTRAPSAESPQAHQQTPMQLDSSEVAVQADTSDEFSSCLATSSVRLERVLGSVVWLGLAATQRASDFGE